MLFSFSFPNSLPGYFPWNISRAPVWQDQYDEETLLALPADPRRPDHWRCFRHLRDKSSVQTQKDPDQHRAETGGYADRAPIDIDPNIVDISKATDISLRPGFEKSEQNRLP